MSKFAYYFSGFISGIYVTQNYNIPNIETAIQLIFNQISYYEKKDNNKNKD